MLKKQNKIYKNLELMGFRKDLLIALNDLSLFLIQLNKEKIFLSKKSKS
jgi:hypothetical protein